MYSKESKLQCAGIEREENWNWSCSVSQRYLGTKANHWKWSNWNTVQISLNVPTRVREKWENDGKDTTVPYPISNHLLGNHLRALIAECLWFMVSLRYLEVLLPLPVVAACVCFTLAHFCAGRAVMYLWGLTRDQSHFGIRRMYNRFALKSSDFLWETKTPLCFEI